MKILYVEDSPDHASAVQRIAKYMGHELVIAPTGVDGRALMQSQQPDLVLLDINLPDANGLDLVREWRAEHYAMPMVVVTGDLIHYNEKKALQAGCNAFIAKPFTVDEMKALFTRFER